MHALMASIKNRERLVPNKSTVVLINRFGDYMTPAMGRQTPRGRAHSAPGKNLFHARAMRVFRTPGARANRAG